MWKSEKDVRMKYKRPGLWNTALLGMVWKRSIALRHDSSQLLLYIRSFSSVSIVIGRKMAFLLIKKNNKSMTLNNDDHLFCSLVGKLTAGLAKIHHGGWRMRINQGMDTSISYSQLGTDYCLCFGFSTILHRVWIGFVTIYACNYPHFD